MKRLTNIIKAIAAAVIIVVSAWPSCVCADNKPVIQYAAEASGNETDDSIVVSLLTCSPGEEVYSLYGHTALRYRDMRTGLDLVFNYGVFNFRKSFFILRFTFGLTDYELGVVPFDLFEREYTRSGRGVVEQVINMTAKEKLAIYRALENNYLPQNRVYRYNYFYDNCTTRARDMIEQCLDGKIVYPDENLRMTYREAIHEHTIGHPWAAFGNDLCLGVKADTKMSAREQQFMPLCLMNDFGRALIQDSDGKRKPLVYETRTVIQPQAQVIEKEFPLSPTQCAYILLCASVAIALVEYKRKKTFVTWDCMLMLVNGIAGLIIVALFFSKHPTTSTNLQVLLINPIPLIYIYNVIRRRKTIYWKLSFLMIVLFFIGSFLQDYAEGMNIVALSLLTRCWIHLRHSTSITSNK